MSNKKRHSIGIDGGILDPETGTLSGTDVVHLSPQMVNLLVKLAHQMGRPVSKHNLISVIWGGRDDGPSDEALKMQMFRLKRLVKKSGIQAEIKSAYGMGYALLSEGEMTDVRFFTKRQGIALDMILDHMAKIKPELVAIIRGNHSETIASSGE